MDDKALVKKLTDKLKSIFCNENTKQKKYAQVWLSKADFGGLYNSGKYVLNVKAEHELPSCMDEISYINALLFRDFTDTERSYIWRIAVYNSHEEIHCESDEISVYSEEETCR